LDQFELQRKIGGGYASTVYLAQCRGSGMQVSSSGSSVQQAVHCLNAAQGAGYETHACAVPLCAAQRMKPDGGSVQRAAGIVAATRHVRLGQHDRPVCNQPTTQSSHPACMLPAVEHGSHHLQRHVTAQSTTALILV
jgi:hypothetical protein